MEIRLEHFVHNFKPFNMIWVDIDQTPLDRALEIQKAKSLSTCEVSVQMLSLYFWY